MDRGRECADVARRDDASGPEAAHRLGDTADVVRDRGDTGAEGAQERTALVEFWAVGEERDRRLAERAIDLAVGQVPEPPVDVEARCRGAIGVDGLERIARDHEPRIARVAYGGNRVAEALIGANDAEAERGAPVVPPFRIAAENRMGNDARFDVEPGERVTAALAVHDDAVEAGEQVAPQLLLRGGSPRQ